MRARNKKRETKPNVSLLAYEILLIEVEILLQIVVEIACDALVQVHALVACHVMALAGIDKEVGLRVGANTCLKERIGVLRHNSGIVETDDDL